MAEDSVGEVAKGVSFVETHRIMGRNAMGTQDGTVNGTTNEKYWGQDGQVLGTRMKRVGSRMETEAVIAQVLTK